MKVDSVCLPGQDRLLEAFFRWEEPARSLFVRSPFEEASYRERAASLTAAGLRADRVRLVRTLREWLEPELLHPEVERSLDRLARPDSLAVVGGQQAGLLGGPLYTIHKAVTLIQLAKREEERLGRPVVPVFWIAGEDHDHAEVDHVWVPAENGTVRKHRFDAGGEPGRPVSHLTVDAERFHGWLDDLAGLFPDSPFKAEWVERLKSFSEDSPSWTRLFARILHHLFGKRGLVLFDAADPAVRRLESPFFRELIDKGEEIAGRVAESAAFLREKGFTPQVDAEKDHGHLFLLVDGRRHLLFRQAGRWAGKDGKIALTTEELLSVAENEPERLSNNVVTRPLMQEFLFPVLAFVGGPGEVAYWALLRGAFESVGMEMPVVVPRSGFTLLDRMSAKSARDFGLDAEALLTRLDGEREEWLRRNEPLDPDALFEEAWRRIREVHGGLVDRLDAGLGMNLREMGEKNLSKIRAQLEFYRNFTHRAIREKHAAALRRWEALARWIRPAGKLQERVYSLIPFWNLYGLDWVDRLAELPPPDETRHTHHRVVWL